MPEQPPCQRCTRHTRSHPTRVTVRNDCPGSVPGSQRGQQSPFASPARLPGGQGGQERWKQVTSASRHSHSPQSPSSHFSPFCTGNTERPASVAKASLGTKRFCLARKSLGKLQGCISASSKLNISGTVSALRPAHMGLRASAPLCLSRIRQPAKCLLRRVLGP